MYDIDCFTVGDLGRLFPVSILRKSISGRHRPVRVADVTITARYRFTSDASWFLRDDGFSWVALFY